MGILITLADMGRLINDILTMVSLIGSSALLIGTMLRAPYGRHEKIKYWSFGALFFASVFQVSMAVTGTTPDEIGLVLHLPPALVTGLLTLSFAMLVMRKWIRWNRKHVAHA